MYSLADYYRRRGLVAQQTLNDQIRITFQEVARGWFELADIRDHLDWREDRLEAGFGRYLDNEKR